MFARYLKSQLMVLLCGGLVGPIFLVVYFALGQLDILKWMFFVGLFITAADVLISLALANWARSPRRRPRRSSRAVCWRWPRSRAWVKPARVSTTSR